MTMKTDTSWRKSSYSSSQGGECLEVRDGVPGVVPVRDSKVNDGPVLTVSASAWSNFLDLARR
ncbi:DUF397 domain-containing protein [Streptomyces triticirhizae]|uniref:DUF397 domain-containing protein n=1 Tax=Streptomyces triticirhizae TaxID=2483353 RepID=A0A3M2LPE3_9ACTN|nr:DUF397 domain-containing protein [Streptomyces triticirhizae]RMI38966.1 DUF397 domain-containing protein [Streptomyces triticirhizae]